MIPHQGQKEDVININSGFSTRHKLLVVARNSKARLQLTEKTYKKEPVESRAKFYGLTILTKGKAHKQSTCKTHRNDRQVFIDGSTADGSNLRNTELFMSILCARSHIIQQDTDLNI